MTNWNSEYIQYSLYWKWNITPLRQHIENTLFNTTSLRHYITRPTYRPTDIMASSTNNTFPTTTTRHVKHPSPEIILCDAHVHNKVLYVTYCCGEMIMQREYPHPEPSCYVIVNEVGIYNNILNVTYRCGEMIMYRGHALTNDPHPEISLFWKPLIGLQ